MTAANLWLGRLRKLSVYRAKGGVAPHKPLLLLVVLEMAEQGQLPAALLPLSPELAFRFFTYWNIVAQRRTQRPDVRLPFYHLQSDGFWEALAEACKRVPHGVVCLLSALRFHGLTTQAPFEVWLAIDRKARLPRLEHPPLRIVRFPAPAMSGGVEEHEVEGVPVRVTTPARTVVDCFVYRNKVGLDVALEALRDCSRARRTTMDELHRAAQARRMANVMRPYLESLA